LGGLVLLIALFIIDGGATLMRFTNESTRFFEVDQNLRFAILRDALHLIAKSSPFGIGPGNFWPVFAIHRHYSFNNSQTAHPESDWVWAAIDAGWLGLIVSFALVCWWISQCRPFQPGTNRLIRAAAMVCGIGFCIHGFFDVSGHRLGALWPAILFASIAMNPQRRYRESALLALVFRIIGLGLIAAGIWWLGSIRMNTPPTSATVERLRAEVDRDLASDQYSEAVAASTRAIQIAPLDWSFYFKRGAAEAALFDSRNLIIRDFAVARYLLPNWPDLYLQEGMIWLGFGESDLAFSVWEEGMERLPQNAGSLYADIFGAVRSDPELRDRWRALADNRTDCILTFLSNATATEFQLELQQLLAANEQLSGFAETDLKRLFKVWYEKGDKLWLADMLHKNVAWERLAWPELARAYADYQDYRQAFETAAQFLSGPESTPTSTESAADLAARFRANPQDPNVGCALALAQAREGNVDEALSTIIAVRASTTARQNLAVVEAGLWARKKEWQRAWQTIAPLVPQP
jgi:hypothetical protein